MRVKKKWSTIAIFTGKGGAFGGLCSRLSCQKSSIAIIGLLLSACTGDNSRRLSLPDRVCLKSDGHVWSQNQIKESKKHIPQWWKDILAHIRASGVPLRLLTPQEFGIQLGLTKVGEIRERFKVLLRTKRKYPQKYESILLTIENNACNFPILNAIYDAKSGTVENIIVMYPGGSWAFERLRSNLSLQGFIENKRNKLKAVAYCGSRNEMKVLLFKEELTDTLVLQYSHIRLPEKP